MAWTPSEWNLLFRQLDATRGDNKYFVMVYCGALQLSDTMRSLMGHGYVDLQVLHWYKFNQNTEGTDNFVYAYELIIIAFRNSRKDVKWYLPKNPLLRHNMIHGPSRRSSIRSLVVSRSTRPRSLLMSPTWSARPSWTRAPTSWW